MQVESPMQGTVVSVNVAAGETVAVRQALVVLESMKMEHVIEAETAGVVESIAASVGDMVMPGDALLVLSEATAVAVAEEAADAAADLDHVRQDLADVLDR